MRKKINFFPHVKSLVYLQFHPDAIITGKTDSSNRLQNQVETSTGTVGSAKQTTPL